MEYKKYDYILNTNHYGKQKKYDNYDYDYPSFVIFFFFSGSGKHEICFISILAMDSGLRKYYCYHYIERKIFRKSGKIMLSKILRSYH